MQHSLRRKVVQAMCGTSEEAAIVRLVCTVKEFHTEIGRETSPHLMRVIAWPALAQQVSAMIPTMVMLDSRWMFKRCSLQLEVFLTLVDWGSSAATDPQLSHIQAVCTAWPLLTPASLLYFPIADHPQLRSNKMARESVAFLPGRRQNGDHVNEWPCWSSDGL